MRAIAAAVLALAAVLVPAGSVSARPGMEIALQDEPVFLHQSYYDREKALAHAEELGVTWLRVNVLWERVLGPAAKLKRAPAAPVYDFTQLDSMVDAAAAHGINVQMTLTGPAPAWATAKRRVGPYKPRPGSYAAFVRAVAQHFKGRVHRYSIWNEPNWPGWLAPQYEKCRRGTCTLAAARVYRRLYQAGWKAIKAVDPTAQVLIGELAPQGRRGKVPAPLTFLREVVRGGGLRTDGFAHHPYAFNQRPATVPRNPNDITMGNLDVLARELAALNKARLLRGPRGKPPFMYLTEYGYFARGPRSLRSGLRSRYLKEGFAIALKHPRVKQILQYQLVAPPKSDPWDTSLIRADGVLGPQFKSLRGFVQGELGKGGAPVPVKKP